MSHAADSTSILIVDDGELEDVAQALQTAGLPFERFRGGQIPDELAPPKDLLIVTPRRLDRVLRGSPDGARPGYPLRIIGVGEDSPAMRRRLRRKGLHLLVRLPAAPEIWQLLIERALYRGEERRRDPRITIGSSVRLGSNVPAHPGESESIDDASNPSPSETLLLDLSNRGCRLQTAAPLRVGESVSFALPVPANEAEPGDDVDPLLLSGTVRRLVLPSDSGACRAAVVFDDDLPEASRRRLTDLINQWAAGPDSLPATSPTTYPALPPRTLPSMPDLVLDDETDPPVRSRSTTLIELGSGESEKTDRRRTDRKAFNAPITAESDAGPVVLIGRDLSPGGMRVEPIGELQVGDRFEIGLHGPNTDESLTVLAEVVRDDGDAGYALAFRDVSPEASHKIEKLVACLPGVESLIEGELASMGAVLSQIIRK